MKFILGKKIGMSQMFDKNGKLTPVTLISAGPCYVLQKMTKEKEGYEALQIGFVKIEKKNKIKKTMKGKEYRHICEFRILNSEFRKDDGNEINIAEFTEGEQVKVSGMSKGKGFQGGVKRHGFHGRRATHGVKHEHRTIGSTGSRFPQHVMKGRKMPGHMGYERISVKNLRIMKVDKENNLLVLKGAVPGRTGALLEIRA
ncbi:MAG: 50S ribosomal protein L3 [Candidatus Staskawiczbacteria bacterium RIFOXYD2_FULL_37_9]|uniref:50S ribosomal protein L3 n=1 Tax=Candidatus Staskawiczbacteria bacterium RIFOXYB1_FULL_37_44 TaxID=1802223 RepID=A0A1G2IXK8_9BACT|nr:MAG: 50S ribosomal protein L3 [Candidatus Staskawiczbacteria bacterium RIFOXYB1_FULL_37_44]OGZ88911.1 MAG: 50S ribosomal protein L3 [Candidatus Staskawiczbacteria bacterium RIFOXYC2_FULL_37_19]OGZ89860.1 MAG: 50S ribosomal protein L3 [Candidatus Staskawiczbacteria bacterium RIFOXYD1_FULL_37_110]OGZ92954.1 MAG: 50S ribosomal protein L3 [Candidatus Staskawiczbacteria bacterium RIFOXYD2_FULL_37_9]